MQRHKYGGYGPNEQLSNSVVTQNCLKNQFQSSVYHYEGFLVPQLFLSREQALKNISPKQKIYIFRWHIPLYCTHCSFSHTWYLYSLQLFSLQFVKLQKVVKRTASGLYIFSHHLIDWNVSHHSLKLPQKTQNKAFKPNGLLLLCFYVFFFLFPSLLELAPK